jgi:outer membrane protein OmpA-like peptidoglycan-associated protein
MPRWLLISLALALGIAGIMLAAPLDNGTATPSVPNYSPDALNALIAVMHESDVDTGSTSIELNGVVSAREEWTQLLEQFQKSVPESVTLSIDVFVIADAIHLDVLCTRMFGTLVDQSVSFRQSGTEFRSSSYAVLDRIVEFAGDCRQSTIVLTGHSDASGNENNNRSLSEARARIVADYLQAHGVAPEQLVVVGAGSDFPIADNATPQGREKNRRIEFALQ